MASNDFHFDVPSIAFGLLVSCGVQLLAAMLGNSAHVAIVGLVCALLAGGVFTIDHYVTRANGPGGSLR